MRRTARAADAAAATTERPPPSETSEVSFGFGNAGGFSSAALTRDGAVLTWGASQNGELGRNTFDNSNVPAPVHGLDGVRVVQMSLGGFHGLALDEQGRVWGWGFNGSMQLGVKDKKIVPVAELLPRPSHAPAVHVAAGGAHSLVVLQDGRCVLPAALSNTKCWGFCLKFFVPPRVTRLCPSFTVFL